MVINVNSLDIDVEWGSISADVDLPVSLLVNSAEIGSEFGEITFIPPVDIDSFTFSADFGTPDISNVIYVESIDISGITDGFSAFTAELFEVPDHDLGIYRYLLHASERFSGVVINQNQAPTTDEDKIAL